MKKKILGFGLPPDPNTDLRRRADLLAKTRIPDGLSQYGQRLAYDAEFTRAIKELLASQPIGGGK